MFTFPMSTISKTPPGNKLLNQTMDSQNDFATLIGQFGDIGSIYYRQQGFGG
jgi:hypothetical protein